MQTAVIVVFRAAPRPAAKGKRRRRLSLGGPPDDAGPSPLSPVRSVLTRRWYFQTPLEKFLINNGIRESWCLSNYPPAGFCPRPPQNATCLRRSCVCDVRVGGDLGADFALPLEDVANPGGAILTSAAASRRELPGCF